MPPEVHYTVEECAKSIRRAPDWILRRIHSDQLVAIFAGNEYLIPESAWSEFHESLKAKGPDKVKRAIGRKGAKARWQAVADA